MLTLYHAAHSTCSQKVRMVLHEKGLAFDEVQIDLAKKEQLKPEYLALNPNGVVPTLVDDGTPIIESSVICEYLDEKHPDNPLLPHDLVERARTRAWMHYIEEVAVGEILDHRGECGVEVARQRSMLVEVVFVRVVVEVRDLDHTHALLDEPACCSDDNRSIALETAPMAPNMIHNPNRNPQRAVHGTAHDSPHRSISKWRAACSQRAPLDSTRRIDST